MTNTTRRLTEQEEFWKGEFGDSYCDRNQEASHQASCVAFFCKALARAQKPRSVIEFGANVGLNLQALHTLFPGIELSAVEINEKAVASLRKRVPAAKTYCQSFLDFTLDKRCDLSFVRGVLIHIMPEMLPRAYEQLYKSSRRDILIAEYYNPTPVEVEYRGHAGRLFKRDFAGEMLEAYPDLELVDYGFVYRRDPSFAQDDITYFLLRKR